MKDRLVLVNLDDEEIGWGEKLDVHQQNQLHRAFSVFLVHDGKMLLQKRNLYKYHSGGLIANACCSHPRTGESLQDAVKRRMKEELGIECQVRELFAFVYNADFPNGMHEYEYDHVFLGDYEGAVYPNPEEIYSAYWVDIHELKEDVLAHPELYCPWFKIALPQVLKEVSYA